MDEALYAAMDMQLTIPEVLERGGVAKWVCRAPKSVFDRDYCTPETSAKADPNRARHSGGSFPWLPCGWVKI